jgi:hypothetical protein
MVMCRKTLSGAEIADFGVAFASQITASLLDAFAGVLLHKHVRAMPDKQKPQINSILVKNSLP